MDSHPNLKKPRKENFCGVDVEDRYFAAKASSSITEGVKSLAMIYGKDIPPMLTVYAVREGLQWLCGELKIPVQSMLDHYRDLFLECSSPVDPHLQGQPGQNR